MPWHRANFSVFYDGPADTWAQGLDVGAVVHWTAQYEDDNVSLTGSPKLNMPRTGPGAHPAGPNNPHVIAGEIEVGDIIDNSAPFPFRARKVAALTTLDLILNYTFNLPPPAPAEVPGFAKDGGKT